MYYILDCDEPLSANGEAMMEIHNCFRVGGIRLWSSGKRHDKPVPVPIEIPFDAFRGYAGPPLEFLDLGIPIMSERMHDVLVGAGIRNVDFYDAVLINNQTQRRFAYKAFNIIGLGDPADSGGLELFRLAHHVKAIALSGRIRSSLLDKGIDTLKFMPLADWFMVAAPD